MRIYTVKLLKSADKDLTSLFTYVADASGHSLNAHRYTERIYDFCQKLSTFPLRGIKRNDLGENVYTISFENRVLIIYKIDDDVVKIMRILYGGRDY